MTSPAPQSRTGDILLRLMPASFVLIWSTGYIGARAAAGASEPLVFLFVRFALAGLILLAAAMVARAPWPRGPRAIMDSIVSGVLLQGIYLGGVFWAIYNGLPAGIAALIVALQPLLTGLFAGRLLGETVTRAHWAGLGLGLCGLGLVIGPRIEFSGAGITPATIGATLVGVLAIVLGSIWQKARASGTDLRTGTFLQYVGGAAVVGLGAVLTEDLHIDWTPQVVLAMAWLVLALSVGAVSLYMLLIRRGAVARVATLFYLVPPCTALIAWLLFGETLGQVQILGMAVTVAGVAVATRRG